MESGKTKKGSVTPNETSDLERLDIVPVRLLAAVRRDYIIPEKFEDFVYVGLVLQGQGMRHGLEAHRRTR